MENDTKQCDTSMYKSLCICSPEFEKIPIHRRELGMAGVTISHTLTIGGALADYKMDKFLESQNISNSIRNFSTLKINTNFGILSFLYKKAEGKSNERASFETGVETSVGILTGKAMQTRLATKVGISLLTRIATGAAAGAAAGSSFPIVGTIIGAVAGALIAGVVNDIIFAEENKALAEAKA
ncbi:hypothetical protein, partial [Helicobacter pullorum]|uniref:hypothetical protein n=2 Tax=Helicobacter pullorum TaxID=35818 RepID=UPI000AAB4F9D